MALPITLNRSRSSIVFLDAETTAGTIATSPNTNSRFGLTTPPVIGQAGNYTDTSEIGPELISVDRVLNYMDYSSFDFEYYAKPGGRASNTPVSLDSSSSTTIASVASGNGYSVTVGVLQNDPSLAVGDTISATYAGTTTEHIVTAVTGVGDPYTFTFFSLTDMSVIGSLTAVSKIGAITEGEEGEIIFRTLGGRKYLSTGEGAGNGEGGYYTGVPNASTNTDYVAPYTTITSSNATAIQYYLANSVNTFTVTSRQFTDNSVQMYTATGSLPTSWSVSLAKDGPVTFSSSFQANRVYYAGTAEVTNSGSNTVANEGTVTYTVTSPLRHQSDTTANAEDIAWFQTGGTKGAVVEVANYDASAGTTTKYGPFDVTIVSGATVTLKNNTGSSITVPANGGAIGDTTFLIPYTPEPCPDTTSVIDQRSVQVYMTDQLTGTGLPVDGTSDSQLFHVNNAIDVTAVSFDFDRSITTPGLTEMTGEEYPPASYVINEPTITGSITLLLRPKDFQLMNSVRAEPHRAIGVEVGTLAGKRIQIAAPSCFLEVPTPGDADGATQIDIPFTVVRGAECEDADKFLVRYF